jgi:hypothetical protein
MPEPNKYIYEIKCLGCGCVAELTVIAGPDYLDSHGSEWLEPQRAALERIGWILHEDLGAYCEAFSTELSCLGGVRQRSSELDVESHLLEQRDCLIGIFRPTEKNRLL